MGTCLALTNYTDKLYCIQIASKVSFYILKYFFYMYKDLGLMLFVVSDGVPMDSLSK